MATTAYRYRFPPEAANEDIEAALVLATWAVEGLHGEAVARLDLAHYLQPDCRACVIDAGSPAGVDLNRLFVHFLMREIGGDGFAVERAQNEKVKVNQ